MNGNTGRVVAVALALLFLLLAGGAGLALVIHGISGFGSEQNISASQEIRNAKAERERKKAEKKTTKTTAKTTTKTEPSTKPTTKKTTTTKAKSSTTQKKTSKTEKSKTEKSKTEKSTTKSTSKKTTKKASGSSDKQKILYLTFDDGPYKYTDKLLDILDKYDVKATFFVTNAYPEYQDLIAKEYERGHTVAVHTYTHDYSKVYASDSAYWKDFDRMNAIVEKQTGTKSTMFRFPGGSSNTVSRRYSSGIMSRLVKQAREKGLTYYDWNVTSGDAGETTSADWVYKNIIEGVREQDRSIILCHDVKSYTVNAMDRTIQWCLDHGYTFRVLSPDGYTVHHGLNN